MSFSVAIIGRPNVGKSTLFNRLVGQKIALVDDRPGVTRDRRCHKGRLQDLHFNVIDTAGLEEGTQTSLEGRMRRQTELAMMEADVILFVVDSRTDLTGVDLEFADKVRHLKKPVVLVANKAEGRAFRENLPQMWRLGLGDSCPISAEHGLGMSDLRDAILKALEKEDSDPSKVLEIDLLDPSNKNLEKKLKNIEEHAPISETIDALQALEEERLIEYDEKSPLRIAVIGRPNVGKSTFINRLLKEDRLLTGPEAGLTRDSIAVDWEWMGRDIKLYDTAGLRRKSRVQEKIEKLSVGETLRAIRFAEIVILMMDATMPFEKQDLQIADLVEREGRALVIVFNKWDKISEPLGYLAFLHEKSQRLLPQISGVRAVPISGLEGTGFNKLMENVVLTHRIWNQRILTAPLNRWLNMAVASHPPPAVSNRRLKIKYITQIKARPPSFVLSCSRKDVMPKAYLRYLINGLRQNFGLLGVPIRLILKTSDNPYAHKAKNKR